MQVENLRNKEKQAKPSQQAKTEITAEDIFLRTEDNIAANTLIDIHHQSQIQSMEEVDTNVQQVRQTNITTNFPTKQIVSIHQLMEEVDINVQQVQQTNIATNLPTRQLVSIPYQGDTNLQQFTETNVTRNL